MNLPMDTLVDIHGAQDGLPDHAIAAMKVIYLEMFAAHRWRLDWDEARLINAAEVLRRAGRLVLVFDEQTGTVQGCVPEVDAAPFDFKRLN